MRMITRMLLVSLLAIGAAAFAGCGDTDCPEAITNQASCSSAGLMCTTSTATCSCDGSKWSCTNGADMPFERPDLSKPRDLTPESD